MVNIRKGVMNMSLQDHQFSLVVICSDKFPHLMDVLSGVGRNFSSLSCPYPQLSIARDDSLYNSP